MSAVERVECVSPVLVPLAEETFGRVAGLAFSARAWLHAHQGAGAWRALASGLAALATARRWPSRAAVVVRSADELDAALARLLASGLATPGESLVGNFAASPEAGNGLPGRLAFLIGGTGAQWPGMGRSLYAHRSFRQAMIDCDVSFSSHVDFRPFEMMSDVGNRAALDELAVAAISTFSLCFSLDRLLRAWGVEADAIAGHSMGEIVGAALAGALSLRDASTVMAAWCEAQQHAPPGQMLVVALPVEEVSAFIGVAMEEPLTSPSGISLAAVNGPRSTTLSGEQGALVALHERLVASGHRCRLLRTGGAFHSHLMEPLRVPLLSALAAISPRPLHRVLYSTVGPGAPLATNFSAEHWWRNLRNPVDFQGVMRRLAGDGYGTFWELGPHPTLSASISECLEGQSPEPAIFTTLQRDVDADESLLVSAGRYFLRGGELAWREIYAGADGGSWDEPVELDAVVAREIPRSYAVAAPLSVAAVQAAPQDARRELLLHAVVAVAAELVGAPAPVLALAVERSWIELGLESLHAVKLKAYLQRELQLEVPLARFLCGESLSSFIAELERQLDGRRAASTAPLASARGSTPRELGSDEVDALLATLVRRCPPDELAALLREVEAAS